MHELGITRNIVAIVAEHAGNRSVKRVVVDIGRLSGVLSDAIRFSFDVVAAGTCVEGAELVIRDVDARGSCRACGGEFALATLFSPCPCGSRNVVCITGEELKVREYELAHAPRAGTAEDRATNL